MNQLFEKIPMDGVKKFIVIASGKDNSSPGFGIAGIWCREEDIYCPVY
jgi:hypothetical protein